MQCSTLANQDKCYRAIVPMYTTPLLNDRHAHGGRQTLTRPERIGTETEAEHSLGCWLACSYLCSAAVCAPMQPHIPIYGEGLSAELG